MRDLPVVCEIFRWSGNVDNIEGTRLESITSFQGLHQIINEPTHILHHRRPA